MAVGVFAPNAQAQEGFVDGSPVGEDNVKPKGSRTRTLTVENSSVNETGTNLWIRYVSVRTKRLQKRLDRGQSPYRIRNNGSISGARVIAESFIGPAEVVLNRFTIRTKKNHRSITVMTEVRGTDDGEWMLFDQIEGTPRASGNLIATTTVIASIPDPPVPEPTVPEGVLVQNDTSLAMTHVRVGTQRFVMNQSGGVTTGQTGVIGPEDLVGIDIANIGVTAEFSDGRVVMFSSTEGEFLNSGRTRRLVAEANRLNQELPAAVVVKNGTTSATFRDFHLNGIPWAFSRAIQPGESGTFVPNQGNFTVTVTVDVPDGDPVAVTHSGTFEGTGVLIEITDEMLTLP